MTMPADPTNTIHQRHTAVSGINHCVTGTHQVHRTASTGSPCEHEAVRRLRTLYDKRIALMGNIAKEQERCRFAHDKLRAMKSDLARLEGNLAEIQAMLREE